MKAARDTPIINAVAMGTSVSALKAIIGAAAVVVTNDTGPRHLALSLAIPSVALLVRQINDGLPCMSCTSDDSWQSHFCPRHVWQITARRTCRIDRIPVSDVVRAVRRPAGVIPIARYGRLLFVDGLAALDLGGVSAGKCSVRAPHRQSPRRGTSETTALETSVPPISVARLVAHGAWGALCSTLAKALPQYSARGSAMA